MRAASVPWCCCGSDDTTTRSSSSSSSSRPKHRHHRCSTPARAHHHSRRGDRPTSPPAAVASRRLVLRSSVLSPLLLLMIEADPTTIVNSILSGYGLPTFKAAAGWRAFDELSDAFTFEYPRSWVARPNSLRQGVYISDFQTADKVAVEVLPAPADGDIATAAVAAAVVPPGRQEDATLVMPARRLVKVAAASVDGQDYVYLEFPSETTTRSGYQIRRRNFAAAAVKRDTLYVLSASARSDQFNEDKRALLQHVVGSFRLR